MAISPTGVARLDASKDENTQRSYTLCTAPVFKARLSLQRCGFKDADQTMPCSCSGQPSWTWSSSCVASYALSVREISHSMYRCVMSCAPGSMWWTTPIMLAGYQSMCETWSSYHRSTHNCTLSSSRATLLCRSQLTSSAWLARTSHSNCHTGWCCLGYNLKTLTHQHRGLGPRTRIGDGNTRIPKQDWNTGFLKNTDNKRELFQFLSKELGTRI